MVFIPLGSHSWYRPWLLFRNPGYSLSEIQGEEKAPHRFEFVRTIFYNTKGNSETQVKVVKKPVIEIGLRISTKWRNYVFHISPQITSLLNRLPKLVMPVSGQIKSVACFRPDLNLRSI